MLVLCVLFGSLIVFRLVGFMGVPVFQTWHESMIFALAVMFCFTAVAHFGPMRRDLERMVPPWVPNARVAVFAAGLLLGFVVVGFIFSLIPPIGRVFIYLVCVRLISRNLSCVQ